MSKIRILPILFLVLFSCKPVTRIQVLQPAALTIPEHIQKIALIDRSKPSGGWFKNLESFFSGEEYKQDQEGRRRAMESLSKTLASTPRFQTLTPGIELNGSSNGRNMLPPLSWYDIRSFCQEYQADGIVCIESFDSDMNSIATPRTVKEKDKNGNETTKIVYDGRRTGTVYIGWRFYDPKDQRIIDEYRDEDRDEKNSYGATSQASAINALPRSYDIAREIAAKLGSRYGVRIAPVYITISRTYYKKIKGEHSEQFEQATRYAESNEWPKAVNIWERIASMRNEKESAGKATYNLAVAAEVSGLLNKAKQLATDAYTQFNLKAGKSYARILQDRIDDQELLNKQLFVKPKS